MGTEPNWSGLRDDEGEEVRTLSVVNPFEKGCMKRHREMGHRLKRGVEL